MFAHPESHLEIRGEVTSCFRGKIRRHLLVSLQKSSKAAIETLFLNVCTGLGVNEKFL